ncbi:MAG: hypothetical protein JWM58_4308 [Rhizobium sp.]|nr:hypothetical protein [Rhizobium sp.]
MARRPHIPTNADIVRDVISSSRLEGIDIDAETAEVITRIAHSDITDAEIKAWKTIQIGTAIKAEGIPDI